MERIEIVEATVGDIPEILALQKLAFRSEAELYRDYSLPPLLQDESSLRKELETGVILKAITGSRIVGSVRACQRQECCHIGKLIVSPESQGHGLGARLMAAIERIYSRADSFKLSTGEKSHKNIHLYEKLGYRIVGREPVTKSLTLVKMEKAAQRTWPIT
jgi:ribosomal protein S18 acetylase RimI-like enzyme